MIPSGWNPRWTARRRRGRPCLLSDYVMRMVHKHAWPISEKGAHGRIVYDVALEFMNDIHNSHIDRSMTHCINILRLDASLRFDGHLLAIDSHMGDSVLKNTPRSNSSASLGLKLEGLGPHHHVLIFSSSLSPLTCSLYRLDSRLMYCPQNCQHSLPVAVVTCTSFFLYLRAITASGSISLSSDRTTSL